MGRGVTRGLAEVAKEGLREHKVDTLRVGKRVFEVCKVVNLSASCFIKFQLIGKALHSAIDPESPFLLFLEASVTCVWIKARLPCPSLKKSLPLRSLMFTPLENWGHCLLFMFPECWGIYSGFVEDVLGMHLFRSFRGVLFAFTHCKRREWIIMSGFCSIKRYCFCSSC